MEALELVVESSEFQLKAVIEKTDAEPAQSTGALMQLTLTLSCYDMTSVGCSPNGSMSSPSCGWCMAIAIDSIRADLLV